jgi:hypothetical protein
MISCILTLYLAVSPASFYACLPQGTAIPDLQPQACLRAGDRSAAVAAQADPDALYARRDDIASAREAEKIWADRLQTNPRDFEAAWKLARVRYWLGGHAPNAERRSALEAGIQAGRDAVRIDGGRPEGHFWTAANMGALAESFGLRQGLKYRGDIRDELLIVLKVDPAFGQGSADRALGRWYYKVPGLFGGSKQKSETHLRRSLDYNPQSTASLYFLAETLVALDREADARTTLEALARAPIDPAWAPEDREFKAKGQALAARLAGRAARDRQY